MAVHIKKSYKKTYFKKLILCSKGAKKIKRIIPVTIFIISVGFFIFYIIKNINDIPIVEWKIEIITVILISTLLMLSNTIIAAIIWHLLLKDYGVVISWKKSQKVFLISQFAKYIPGNIGQYLGRVIMAKNVDIPVATSLSTMFIELMWLVSVGMGLAVFSISFFIDNNALVLHYRNGIIGLSIGAIILLFLPWLVISILNNKFISKLTSYVVKDFLMVPPKKYTALIAAILYLICFVIIGLVLKLHAQWFFNVSEVGILKFTCLFAIAWIAGYLTPGAPGGLGVRESVMVLLFSPIINPGVAVGISITFRIVTTLSDAVAFILGIVIRDAE